MEPARPDLDTVDHYLEGCSPDSRAILERLRAIVRDQAPGAIERIAYGMPTFTLGKNLIHFAAFQNHIGVYPTPSGTEAFEAELTAYKRGKGSIQFPLNQPFPFDLFARMVQFRIAEVQAQTSAKTKK